MSGPVEVAEFKTPAPDGLIEALEAMLVEARAGNLLGLIAVGCNVGGLTSSLISVGSDSSIMALLGELEATKIRFALEHVDGCGG